LSESSNAPKSKSGAPAPNQAPPPPPFHPPQSHAPAEDHGEGNWLVSYADMMTLLVGFFVILMSFSTMDPQKLEEAKKSITKEFGGQYHVPYSELVDRIKDAAQKLGVGDQFLIKQSDVGVEISSRGTVFFDSGSADLKPEARSVLGNMIQAIMIESKDFDIIVEGHTDDVPIMRGGAFRNNWELSSLRACRVLEAFSADGYPKDHLTATGYGESRPLVPNRDSTGNGIAENQGQNRRVVIKVLKPAQPALPLTRDAASPATPQ
jgi:chemotaxis protein MotB